MKGHCDVKCMTHFSSYMRRGFLGFLLTESLKHKPHFECSLPFLFSEKGRGSPLEYLVLLYIETVGGRRYRRDFLMEPRPIENVWESYMTYTVDSTNGHQFLLHQRNQWWTPSPCPTYIRNLRTILGLGSSCQIPATKNCWSSSGTNHRSLARMCIFKIWSCLNKNYFLIERLCFDAENRKGVCQVCHYWQ